MIPASHAVARSTDAIGSRRWWTLAVLCLSLLLIVANNASLNIALPNIQTALHADTSALQWIVDVYSLVFASLLLPAGALADRFGRKLALQLGLIVFIAGALLATVSNATWQLVVCRGVMGVGAAFIMPGTLSVLTNVFHDVEERRRAIAIWAGCAGLGGSIGVVVSGIVLEKYWWGSVFFVNVPIAALALVAGLWLVPNSSDPSEATLDPIGVLLAVSGLSALLYGIIEAPESGWGDPVILGAFGLAIVVLTTFGLWELHNRRPMLDIRLFRVRPFSVGSSTILLQYFALYGLYFAMAQYLQFAHGYSALATALASLPIGIFSMVGAPMSAPLVRRFGPRLVVGSGLIVTASGFVILATVTPTTGFLVLCVGFVLVGTGGGQTTAPSTTLIMSSVRRAKAGVGSAVNDLSRELGGALGIAVLGSIMASVYSHDITRYLGKLPASARGVAAGSVTNTITAGRRLPPGAAHALKAHAEATFAHGFGVAMLLGAGMLAVTSVLVWVFQFRGAEGQPEGVVTAQSPVLTSTVNAS